MEVGGHGGRRNAKDMGTLGLGGRREQGRRGGRGDGENKWYTERHGGRGNAEDGGTRTTGGHGLWRTQSTGRWVGREF